MRQGISGALLLANEVLEAQSGDIEHRALDAVSRVQIPSWLAEVKADPRQAQASFSPYGIISP
jgi:hypothetical protein